MELLAYVLAIFGLVMLLKGIKPSIEVLNNATEKELIKGIGLIAAIITIIILYFRNVKLFNQL